MLSPSQVWIFPKVTNLDLMITGGRAVEIENMDRAVLLLMEPVISGKELPMKQRASD